MDIIKEHLLQGLEELTGLLEDCERELAASPSGRLQCAFKSGSVFYTHADSANGLYFRHGISQSPDLIARLARKEYFQKTAAAARWNVLLLQKLLDKYRSLAPEQIVKQLSRAAGSLPANTFLNPADSVEEILKRQREWALAPFEQSTYKPEEKIHLTSAGIYVRSKSEALIMEKLYDKGVVPRYEQFLMIRGKQFAPDFSFVDHAGDPFYWEHAGKMSDPLYARRHYRKMEIYQYAGIVPWNNLIVTYDSIDGAINMGLIDSIVTYQVLPRLTGSR